MWVKIYAYVYKDFQTSRRRRVERPSAAAAAVVDIFIYLEKRESLE